MKIYVDIPEQIYSDIKSGYGRIYLQRKFNIDQSLARYFIKSVELGVSSFSSSVFQYRELILADMHIPEEDIHVLRKFIAFGIQHDITGVTVLGDGVNFEQFSRWLKNPMMPRFCDVQSHCVEIFKMIREMFPFAKLRYIKGNHEDWLRQYIWDKASALAGLKGNSIPELLELDEWEYIDTIQRLKDGLPPLELGGYYLLHGHERKVGMNVINVPRIFYEKHFHRSCIIGHYHRSQFWSARAIDHTYDLAFSIGCCRTLNPGWAAHNQWNHGCALLCWNDDDRLGTLYNKIFWHGEFI